MALQTSPRTGTTPCTRTPTVIEPKIKKVREIGKKNMVPVMLQEPNYSDDTFIDDDSISQLSVKCCVSTKMIAILTIPYNAKENLIIISTTLVEPLLKVYFYNVLSLLPQHNEFVKQKFEELQYFALQLFKIYICSA